MCAALGPVSRGHGFYFLRGPERGLIQQSRRRDHALTRRGHAGVVIRGEVERPVLAAQETAAQRRPRHHAEPQRPRHRHQFMFDAPFDEAVFDLQRDERSWRRLCSTDRTRFMR